MNKLSYLFAPALAALSTSCSEPVDVAVVNLDVEVVSCNGQTDAASLAVYVGFDVANQSDSPIEILSVEVGTRSEDTVVIEGTQALSPALVIPADRTGALSCKDGFGTTFPGDNTKTDIFVEVRYRQDGVEASAIGVGQMGASIAWDNCGGFLGNPVACHLE